MAERIYVFIDGSNLYHSTKEICGDIKISFGKLAHHLANGREGPTLQKRRAPACP